MIFGISHLEHLIGNKVKPKSNQSSGKVRSWLELSLTILFIMLLFATNPSQQDFKDYLKHERIEKVIENEGMEASFSEIFDGISSWYDNAISERNNYIIFSLYLVPDPDIEGTKRIYFGGLNHFVKVI